MSEKCCECPPGEPGLLGCCSACHAMGIHDLRVPKWKTREELVAEFHAKFGFPTVPVTSGDAAFNDALNSYGKTLKQSSKELLSVALALQARGDHRFYRVHLMVEELSEIIMALAYNNEIQLADGLADLQYVLSGTAVTYGMPLQALFEEAHRSNMSKSRDPNDPRMKAKDPSRGYSAPDFSGVLKKARKA